MVTILGIIISVAMFTAVTTGTASVMNFFQKIEMEDSGYWHVEYKDVTKDVADKIAKDSNTEYLSLSQELGYSLFSNSAAEQRPYLYIMAMDTKGFDMMNIELASGRLPENENEILISKPIQKNSSKAYEIGDTFEVDLGQRFQYNDAGEKTKLDQNNWYQTDENGEANETWETNGDHRSLTIVGIMEEPKFDYGPGFTVISGITKEPGATYSAKVFLDTVDKDYYKDADALAQKLSISQVEYHSSLLKYYGVSADDSYNAMIENLEIILIAIIMVGSISLIYNSFAISISERTKQFGMLSSVGTTKRQKMHAVLYEGFLCGCVSIPVGILAGLLGIGITFWAINPLFQNAFGIDLPLEMVISSEAIIIAAIVSAITIIISAYLPARRASKITAMEAIRQQKDIKVSPRSLKTNRFNRQIFGLEGDLALKNLKRNKKRYRVIVFSLGISIVLFISVSAYTHYLTAAVELTNENNTGDVFIGNISYEEVETVLPSLKSLDTLSDITVMYNFLVDYQLSDDDSKWYATKEWLDMPEKEDYNLDWKVTALEDSAFVQYADHNQIIIPENSKAIPAIIINRQRDAIQYTITDFVPMQIEPNTELTVKAISYDGALNKDTINFNVVATTDQLPLGMSYDTSSNPIQVIIPASRMKELPRAQEDADNIVAYTRISCNTNAPEKITAQIQEILDREVPLNDAHIYNNADEVIRSKQMVTVFNIFAYGFIVLISLISIANMCNTISTSFAVRRSEFAVLKSVGMTPGAFKKMIVFESLLYGIKALVFGLPLGMVFNYLIYKSVSDNFTTNYAIPYMTYAVAVISVFAVVGVAMIYSTSKTRKDNIIDGLKSEII
jgi:putative ABC transport system permease protein